MLGSSERSHGRIGAHADGWIRIRDRDRDVVVLCGKGIAGPVEFVAPTCAVSAAIPRNAGKERAAFELFDDKSGAEQMPPLADDFSSIVCEPPAARMQWSARATANSCDVGGALSARPKAGRWRQ